MIRRIQSTLLAATAGTALCLGMASTASAVEFSLVSPGVTTPLDSDFTIEVLMTNVSETSVSSLGASVYEYDGVSVDPMVPDGPVVATFVSGSAVPNYFNQFCPAPGTCFGGLDNLSGAGPLEEGRIGANGLYVQIAVSAALTPVSSSGVGVDQGLDGNVGTAMFAITMKAKSSGTITIGTGYEGDGIVLPDGSDIQATPVTFTLTIPEPGAMLAGVTTLGSVVLLAGIRRRS